MLRRYLAVREKMDNSASPSATAPNATTTASTSAYRNSAATLLAPSTTATASVPATSASVPATSASVIAATKATAATTNKPVPVNNKAAPAPAATTAFAKALANAPPPAPQQGDITRKVLQGATAAVQVAAQAGKHIPVVGAAASLLLQLIALCDQYRCNKIAFTALKARMSNLHQLYFGRGGETHVQCGKFLSISS